MHLLYRMRDMLVDFLFPKSQRVWELEALSIETLLDTLPPAESLKDKHILALFDYKHPLVKEMVWELKYNGNAKIADKLGRILYDHIQHELADLDLFESASWRTSKLIIMPVPISAKRRLERGWNQSELLCKQIIKRDNKQTFKYAPRQLVKIRHTESQTKTASRNERLKNLIDSMKVLNPPRVAGACVIVLDDVTTTGATFTEARRALGTAGAKKILCIAIAH